MRLHAVPETERLAAQVSPETRRRAITQLLPELATFAALGAPGAHVVDQADAWIEEVATMAANFPADLRIERWIHDQFPGLHSMQALALSQEVERGFPLLAPRVRLAIAPTVYHAKMSMNAAEALNAAELTGRPGLFEPYRRHGFEAVAQQMCHLVFDAGDEGHRSDMLVANAWAGALGVGG